jgi:hypothetical protein
MQVEALALQLRPRPMFEAADLGVRLVQANARSVWRCYAPLWAALALIALSTAGIAAWLPYVVLFCCRPWLDRSLLFVCSRAVFGDATTWSDLWSAQRRVWWDDLLWTFTMWRLSPWRAYVQPLRQLEEQRGRPLHRRRVQVLLGKRGAVSMLQLVYVHLEYVLVFGVYLLAAWMTPGDDHFTVLKWLFNDEGPGAALVGSLTYAAAMLVLEPFYVASGFAMYLNRRVELEAWDIEQEFRHAFGR